MRRIAPLSVLAALLAAGEAPPGDAVFPAFQDLPPALQPAQDGHGVSSDGFLTLGGRRQYLVGPQLGEGLVASYQRTAGYDDSLKWLYEAAPTYEALARLGFNTYSFFVTDGWTRRYVPEFWGITGRPAEEQATAAMMRTARLPVYVDFTCAGWTNGFLEGADWRAKSKIPVPPEAINVLGSSGEANHWVPYSLGHPEGIKLYREMFAAGTEWFVKQGGDAFVYELFNEPAYHDPSPHNRALFAERLKAQYRDIATLNARWKTAYPDFAAVAAFKTRGDNPGLFVAWSRFMESLFTERCGEFTDLITETIRKHLPAGQEAPKRAPTAVQSLGGSWMRLLPSSHVNIYELSKVCSVTSTPTGGCIATLGSDQPPANAIDASVASRGYGEAALLRRYLLSFSRGRPIYDGEAYMPGDREGCVTYLWRELMYGSSATYWFKWDKRAWDWKGDRMTAASEGEIAKRFPYLILVPKANPTPKLAATMDFRRELLPVEDLFVRRDNRGKAEVALLMSNATGRWSQAVGNGIHNEILPYSGALSLGHWTWDCILEELIEEEERQREYRVIIAAGVPNTTAGTVQRLAAWAQAGGTLVLGLETMQEDEYGHALAWPADLGIRQGRRSDADATALQLTFPADPRLPGAIQAKPHRTTELSQAWRPIATLAGAPAIAERAYGAGRVVLINTRLAEYPLAAVLGGILAQAGIGPQHDLRTPKGQLLTGVETWRCAGDGETGHVLFNLDAHPKPAVLAVPSGAAVLDVTRRQLLEVRDGRVAVHLPAWQRAILVSGPREALLKRIPGAAPIAFDAVLAAATADLDAHLARLRARPEAQADAWPIDSARARMLDLRGVANRDFEDATPGDGKGGWTDQGENSLLEAQWGQQRYAGVPVDIIRPDSNAFRAVLVLKGAHIENVPSEASGIAVDGKVENFYLAHATAWTADGEEAYRLIVRYADGSTAELPQVMGRDVGEWWMTHGPGRLPNAYRGFVNSHRKGFWISRQANPHPGKDVASLAVRTGGKGAIPIIVGITIEAPEVAVPGTEILFDGRAEDAGKLTGWGGSAFAVAAGKGRDAARAALQLNLEPNAQDWSGAVVTLAKPVALTPQLRAGHLEFWVRGGLDEWGKGVGRQQLQINGGQSSPGDGRHRVGPYTWWDLPEPVTPERWVRARIPLSRLLAGRADIERLDVLSFQWMNKPAAGGILIDGIRLVPGR